MSHAIRQKLIVDREGILEIRSPEFHPGATADVIIILDDADKAPRRLTDLIGTGKGLYASPADVDAFLRGEREAWNG